MRMAMPAEQLKRTVGLISAILLGLGSILGTGVFISLGLAAGSAGPSLLVAIVLAGAAALCSALSSAQLAASFPVSGGTYEYGHRYLTPGLGFLAGWMFLTAKSASAATAALGIAGAALALTDITSPAVHVWVAVGSAALLIIIAAGGIRLSNLVNAALVAVTLAALLSYIVIGMHPAIVGSVEYMHPFWPQAPVDVSGDWQRNFFSLHEFLEAAALVFVAFTGFGRVATLGEEIKHPQRNIPIAIVTSLLIAVALYLAVAFVSVGNVGPRFYLHATEHGNAPLQAIAEQLEKHRLAIALSIGAITAMGAVLLNLLLGLSRVVLAMGRRRDMPRFLALLDEEGQTPYLAVLFVGLIVIGLIYIGNVRYTWSLSAFTVLIYYGLTNLAALCLPAKHRRFPRVFAVLGLLACLSLAACVDRKALITGLILLGVGLVWRTITAYYRHRTIGGSVPPAPAEPDKSSTHSG
ncbi:MAG: amino acid permease [Planctomycetes bacterium]|nr:amino acid permease [Planctomycetota bacterium]